MLGLLVSYSLGVALIAYLAYRWKWRKLFRFADTLDGPPSYPIIGNALDLRGTLQDFVPRLLLYARKYPSPFRIWLGHMLFAVVTDPEHFQTILTSSKSLSKGLLYKFFEHSVGNGLFVAPVEKWKRNRRILTPAFNSKLLEHFMPVFISKTQVMMKLIEKELGKGEFNIFSYILPMSLDTICQTALGVNIDAQTKPSQFSKAVHCVSQTDYTRIYKIWLHPEFIFKRSSLYKKNKWAYEIFHQLPNEVIKKRREEYRLKVSKRKLNDDPSAEEETQEIKNFLDILIDLSENGVRFTDVEIRDEVITMMVAGSETTALTDSFCLLMLGIHQDIQEKVLEEIDTVFGDSNREVTLEDLPKLVYLEQVIKETLRMWPPAAIILRNIDEDVKLSNCILPAGCTAALAAYALHMDEKIYPNPKKFDPSRFTPENIASRHKYSFLPFSGGPRSCIGSKYAMLSMKTTLSSFLRRYRVYSTCKIEDIRLELGLLMMSVDGYPVQIKERKPIVM